MEEPQKEKRNTEFIDIPPERILEMAKMQSTVTEIAAFFKCSIDTVYRRVPASQIQEAREGGLATLRAALYQRALGGKRVQKNSDGSETITYTRSSDRLFKHALERYLGPVTKKVEVLTPTPVIVAIDEAQMERVLAKLLAEN